jgi:hypothetical protein
MRRLATSYSDFVFENVHLITLLTTETANLSTGERRRIRAAERARVDEWVQLLRQVHPEWEWATAHIRVHAALTALNDIARPRICAE